MMDEAAATSASEFDLANIHEEEFELHTTYIVPDLPVDSGTPNRAEATLPRNLVLKTSQALSDVKIPEIRSWQSETCNFQAQGVWSTGYIPRGTRFGPLVGEIYAKDAVPSSANRKYFWRVSCFYYCVKCFGYGFNSALGSGAIEGRLLQKLRYRPQGIYCFFSKLRFQKKIFGWPLANFQLFLPSHL